jgi:alkylation response protein AidB-like acyl-CoA dehydrogenase
VLPGVIDGSRQLTLAYAEPQSRFDLHDVTTTAKRDGDGFVINGHKSMVLHAATAQQIVVSARTSGGQIDTGGISLFWWTPTPTACAARTFPPSTGCAPRRSSFKNVKVAARGCSARSTAATRFCAPWPTTPFWRCRRSRGHHGDALQEHGGYTQERVQFDHPLADFQVLQHRMVDMFMEYEQCKSLLYRATMEDAQGDPTPPSAPFTR